MVGETSSQCIRREAKSSRAGGGSSGFSLVELVVVIAITGVIAGVVGVFITGPVLGFFDQARRAELVDAGQLALVRMGRDLRAALPNSVRVSGAAVELLLTLDGDRYRTEPATGATPADQLEFNIADPSFNTFRRLGAGQLLPAGLRLAVYPLGAGSGADPYVDAVLTPSTIAVNVTTAGTPSVGGVTEYRVTMQDGLGNGHRFKYESPSRRVFLVQGPVMYHCAGGNLLRYEGYDVLATLTAPPTTGGTGAVIIPDIVQSCAFNYDPGTAQRNAVASLTVVLADPAAPLEIVRLVRQVQVSNVP